ncbi:DUF4132 domain-containing protein [Actinomadura macrotermitis]|uniref:DUF4132 domain-containing protein n=1 Tax=Actinomadura macrotermitis TaxID=2585200 RepID=A0A7K0C7A3_9ACTN|nr:DUF4132 domain-containing protein [Actinomadura macrotermitis]MQY09351.1 hypothetical protein [Actinomadura macrotermitis]
MDEPSSLVLPKAWQRRLHPRRGGLALGLPAPDAIAAAGAQEMAAEVRELEEAHRPLIEKIIAGGTHDRVIADGVRAHLDGADDPVGAAAVALIIQALSEEPRHDRLDRFPCAWALTRGLAFAACAAVELNEIQVGWDRWCDDPFERAWTLGRPGAGEHIDHWWSLREDVLVLRAALAVADEAGYRQVVDRLAGHRVSPLRRAAVSYLVPGRPDWLEECIAEECGGFRPNSVNWMLWCSVSTAGQADRLWGWAPWSWSEREIDVLATMLEGLGADTAPFITRTMDGKYVRAEERKRFAKALSFLHTDEAFRALLERGGNKDVRAALTAAVKEQPQRAARLLPEAAAGKGEAAVIAATLLADLAVAEPPEHDVPPTVELPGLLVSPPWTRPRKGKPVVLPDLTAPAGHRIVWGAGEREEWAATLSHYWRRSGPDTDWELMLRNNSSERGYGYEPVLLAEGPEELIRPLLPSWRISFRWGAEGWTRAVVARFELDVRATVLDLCTAKPDTGGLLLPYLDAEVAALMADWLVRLKSARRFAEEWLTRHGADAVPLLVPAALGKAGKERRAAEAALQHIAATAGADAVTEAARAYGDEAADAIATLLATDPLDVLPARIPKAPDWADARRLPRLVLREGGEALPAAAAAHVVTMLAMPGPYAGVDVVRELCTPGSLAEFGWALFERWRAQGMPAKDGWALTQLGLTGDDETVRRLTPIIRAWPGEGGHTKAVAGLDVLAAIGTGIALLHLHGIAQRLKFKALKTRAQEKIEEVAEGLGLTPDQLADRLVPDFDLDGLVLDYGPRRFTVGFDEQLKPYVLDASGKRLKALPKPGAKDDPELAPAAHQRFAALKKDVRTVAADQVRRLEAAMVRRRRWSAAEFHDLFAAHPLLRHPVARLVWITDGGAAFRVAEDGTLADVHDDACTLPEGAEVGIAHPLDLDVAAWGEVFADYEIVQPFPQLGRAVHALTGDERAAARLARFEGITVPTGKVLGLERLGWERGAPQDGGVQGWISRRVSDDRYVVVSLEPGIIAGYADEWNEQLLEEIRISPSDDPYGPAEEEGARFGDLDPVTASEILAELTGVTD